MGIEQELRELREQRIQDQKAMSEVRELVLSLQKDIRELLTLAKAEAPAVKGRPAPR